MFFQGKEMLFKNLDFNKRCKNEIKDNNEKLYSLFRDSLSQKIDFTAYGHHRDHPSVRKLAIGARLAVLRELDEKSSRALLKLCVNNISNIHKI